MRKMKKDTGEAGVFSDTVDRNSFQITDNDMQETAERDQNMDRFSSLIFHLSSFRRKRGFTLIELLVVIAIIAILAALLLPALNQARKTARAIKCTGQMKTMAYEFMEYTQDYNNFLVPVYWNGTTKAWWGTYLIRTGRGVFYQADAKNTKWRKAANNAFHCPEQPTGTYGLTYGKRNSAYYVDYGLNVHVRKYDFSKVANWPRLTHLRQSPSIRMLQADANARKDGFFRLSNSTSASTLTNQFAWRHGMYFNASFEDGHVEKVERSRLRVASKALYGYNNQAPKGENYVRFPF